MVPTLFCHPFLSSVSYHLPLPRTHLAATHRASGRQLGALGVTMPVIGKAKQSEPLILIACLLGHAATFQLVTPALFDFVTVRSHKGSKSNARHRFSFAL